MKRKPFRLFAFSPFDPFPSSAARREKILSRQTENAYNARRRAGRAPGRRTALTVSPGARGARFFSVAATVLAATASAVHALNL
jgi:hypothetical protein